MSTFLHALRGARGYYVGEILPRGSFVWSKHISLAQRFDSRATAAKYVRDSLSYFTPEVHDLRVVKIRVRNAEVRSENT